MKLKEIQKGKKYIKLSASLKKKRGERAARIQNEIFVLELDPQNNRVLASVNKMPPLWYNQASYARWSPVKPQKMKA